MVEDVPEILIKQRYLKAPTLEQIHEFIDEMGVSYSQFERYYSMPYGVIRQVNIGTRNLPVKFWGIVYEKIVPKYGMTYKEINNMLFQKGLVTKVATKRIPSSDNHGRLTDVK